jgi:hypothetical protein
VVDHAVQRGIKVAFENQRMLANLAWAMEAFPDQGFCWDCGHESCFTPGREYMPLFGKRLICTHIHDNSGEFNADNHQLPFDGAMDFDRFARHIKASGYTGSLMLEVMAHDAFYPNVTPEEYLSRAADAAKRLLSLLGTDDLPGLPARLDAFGAAKAAAECGTGEHTLTDIAKELSKPGRDPRDELPAPILRMDVLEMKDLKPGMELTGTVRNVIDFGVFVDIGVHQDGLVHISEVSNRRLRHPSEAVRVGDIVKVVVLSVDVNRHRISLSMKQVKDA